MIEIKRKEECCGCNACANICPHKCIKMREDEEGFLYPYVDKTVCVDCKLCEKVCPVINVAEDLPFEQKAFLVQNKNSDVRRESTSGGAFTPIAEYVISKNGIVYGAAYDNDFNVEHIGTNNIEEISKFRNSKYVQSNTKYTFKEVKKHIENGRLVCYSGTPCQIEGLKTFLGKDYPNLITVDVVCHAVSSPLIWRKYVQMQKRKYGDKINNIMFRDKYYNYQYSTMSLIDSESKRFYHSGIDTDPMLRAFFMNMCDRPSCHKCCFKKRYRVSDFTIWDCYTADLFDKNLDADGTTRVLIHSEKGYNLFKQIVSQFNCFETSADKLTSNVREMFKSVDVNSKRQNFFKDAYNLEPEKLFKKYFPVTLKTITEKNIRILLSQTKFYVPIKRTVKKIINRVKR